jgi:hypothetical protein
MRDQQPNRTSQRVWNLNDQRDVFAAVVKELFIIGANNVPKMAQKQLDF